MSNKVQRLLRTIFGLNGLADRLVGPPGPQGCTGADGRDGFIRTECGREIKATLEDGFLLLWVEGEPRAYAPVRLAKVREEVSHE